MTDLKTAINELAAVRVGRGIYCYHDDAMNDLYVVGVDDMRDLGKRLAGKVAGIDPRDCYSRWCADTLSERPTTAQLNRYARG